MASLDLKDAYYSVPISEDHRKCLKFRWRGELYHYTCLPNGLSSALRLFTKLLKPVLSHLRACGLVSSIYLDDLQGDTYDECLANIYYTVNLLSKLGFFIHLGKSKFIPTQIMNHLGFTLDSVNMCVSLTKERQDQVVKECQNLLHARNFKIVELAKLTGILVSCVLGIEYSMMHYRHLEIQKTLCLRESKGSYNGIIAQLTDDSKNDIQWWLKNFNTSRKITHGAPEIMIRTDASKDGWGAAVGFESTGGRWAQEETYDTHINVLELKAAFLGLQSFRNILKNRHVLIQMDNTTSVAFVRNMGVTHSSKCNSIAINIWEWCQQNNIWLSATHVPGIENIEADRESRNFVNNNTEWSLQDRYFEKITKMFGTPDIDLFASRTNNKLPVYFAWRPDPGAIGIDAFCQEWNFTLMYAFPPFSIITRKLQKIEESKATVILIVPSWPAQPWFPRVLHMLIRKPLLLPTSRKILTLAHNLEMIHPLWRKLKLIACLVPGEPSKQKEFLRQHKTLSCKLGGGAPGNSTSATSTDGYHLHVQGISIPCIPI